MLTLHPNILEKDGKKAFAVLHYEEFLKLQEELDKYEDLKDLRAAKANEEHAPVESLSSVRNTLNILANKRHRPRQMSQPLAVSAVSFVGHAIRFTMGLTPHIMLCESMCGDNNHGYESTT